ncbi:LysR family transcriptional regulator [Roseococcus sp. SDR]|uniref:LysR substrate-binding domain-containing protein n=1 Tax=Roseococcus sp. SDR TaxID=2835532 RepID=UPI001BCFF300|nr:LysR substrate-binding domain-containing protein [Roseococcus sp. SDR]MBS7791659.1 LysR family transcriptional regulator [Roseococcus sp. SDR]MBV1846973.1 LysR family transcriptional regulator [Roseococcus sp. SDR]
MTERGPSLQNIWTFHLIAESGSIAAAAAALRVTPPAVSRRLRELEQALGCPLVRRGPNALSLTEPGRRFAEALRAGFAQIEAAKRALRTQPAPLRIRAYTTWALRWLIPRLADFKRAHPSIDVEVSTSTAPVDLARDDVDAAVRTAPLKTRASATLRPLQPVTIAPFAAPALAASLRGGLDQVQGGRLLGSKARARDWAIWQRHAGLAGTPVPLLFESTTLAIQAALEGLGVVICSPGLVREEVRAGRLVALAEAAAMTGDSYWLVLPQGRISPSLRLFADWLVQEAARDAGTT